MEPVVVGIGEIVWDMLPEGKRLGGAPLNFAFYAKETGARAYAVSAVGDDPLGKETVEALGKTGVDFSALQVNSLPTSRVNVTLSGDGIPQYEIVENVAWDALESTSEALSLVGGANAVCWGSLAQRSPLSRSSILSLLSAAPKSCLKVFDINLRQHYYSREVVEPSLREADILKLNEDELPVVLSLTGEKDILSLIRRYSLKYVVYTLGAAYSEVYDASGVISHIDTPRVAVRDTVGAGDSFTAVFVTSLLHGKTIPECHEAAVKVSAEVCTFDGAIHPLK